MSIFKKLTQAAVPGPERRSTVFVGDPMPKLVRRPGDVSPAGLARYYADREYLGIPISAEEVTYLLGPVPLVVISKASLGEQVGEGLMRMFEHYGTVGNGAGEYARQRSVQVFPSRIVDLDIGKFERELRTRKKAVEVDPLSIAVGSWLVLGEVAEKRTRIRLNGKYGDTSAVDISSGLLLEDFGHDGHLLAWWMGRQMAMVLGNLENPVPLRLEDRQALVKGVAEDRDPGKHVEPIFVRWATGLLATAFGKEYTGLNYAQIANGHGAWPGLAENRQSVEQHPRSDFRQFLERRFVGDHRKVILKYYDLSAQVIKSNSLELRGFVERVCASLAHENATFRESILFLLGKPDFIRDFGIMMAFGLTVEVGQDKLQGLIAAGQGIADHFYSTERGENCVQLEELMDKIYLQHLSKYVSNKDWASNRERIVKAPKLKKS